MLVRCAAKPVCMPKRATGGRNAHRIPFAPGQKPNEHFTGRSQRQIWGGKKILPGNWISFSHRRSPRRWVPNVQPGTVRSVLLGEEFHTKLSTSALRTIDKHGGSLDRYLLLRKSKYTDPGLAQWLRKRMITKFSELTGHKFNQLHPQLRRAHLERILYKLDPAIPDPDVIEQFKKDELWYNRVFSKSSKILEQMGMEAAQAFGAVEPRKEAAWPTPEAVSGTPTGVTQQPVVVVHQNRAANTATDATKDQPVGGTSLRAARVAATTPAGAEAPAPSSASSRKASDAAPSRKSNDTTSSRKSNDTTSSRKSNDASRSNKSTAVPVQRLPDQPVGPTVKKEK